MAGIIKDYLFPPRCPVCGAIVSPRWEMTCSICKDVLVRVAEPRCKRCSKPILSEEAQFCYDCSKDTFHYIQGAALWVYDKAMKKSIAAFKYAGRKEYAVYYAEQLLQVYGNWLERLSPDALIPVPLHKSKERARGFNQAALLARGVGKPLGLPVMEGVLVRNKKTRPQKELNDRERQKNLEQAFLIKKSKEEQVRILNKVILVDDIYTTGSTIEACSRVLKEAGVRNVYFLALCIGKGF